MTKNNTKTKSAELNAYSEIAKTYEDLRSGNIDRTELHKRIRESVNTAIINIESASTEEHSNSEE